MTKLDELLEIEGYGTDAAGYDAAMMDCTIASTNPGICMNDGCDYTTDIEPDSSEGFCEVCGTKTVSSMTNLLLF